MVEVANNLRNLKDFPAYDASFLDGPKFRQNLSHWAIRTEKLAGVFTNLADQFTIFHESGLQHHKAAIKMVSCVHDIGHICNSSLGSTVSTPLQNFAENMNKIWCYYDVFLGQTKMLNIGPIRDLATTFVNLKRLYEELLHYREEYRTTAENLCACRHMSNLPDKSTFASLTEACYSAEKTYRLILSKYLTLLRQSHTKDIMVFIKRIVEHLLSLFAYHTNTTSSLKEIEPEVNDFFTKSKEWHLFYDEELTLWSKLHNSVQRHIMAEFQLNIGLIPKAEGKLPKLKKFASTPSKKDLKSIVITSPVEASPSHTPTHCLRSQSDKTVNGNSHNSSPKTTPTKAPLMRTQSSPIDPDDPQFSKSTEANIINSNCELLDETPTYDGRPVSLVDTKRGGDGSISMDIAAERMEQLLHSNTHSSSGSTSPSIFQTMRGKLQKKLRKGQRESSDSLMDVVEPTSPEDDRSSSGSPPEGQSPVMGRKTVKGGNSPGIFRLNRKKGKEVASRLKSSVSHPEKLGEKYPSKESLTSPPSASPTLQNGDVKAFEEGVESVQQRISRRDPSHKVSYPILIEKKEVQIVSYNLQKLVKPLPKSWIKCGYLWLRMKLPNNIYAWTYIYCVVDRDKGELMIQEQNLPQPRKLENLMLCNTRPCKPDFIDRNYCFRVISPTSEHLFQAVNDQQMGAWVSALQETTEEALKRTDHRASRPELLSSVTSMESTELVSEAMEEILAVPGNRVCADCSSTVEVEWASVNLGIVMCIKCSGVHRGLGVHVSKVRSLNLDKWDRPTVDFMVSQGNRKSNGYYEATLGEGLFEDDVKRPNHSSKKDERMLFIQRKYVSLTFVPDSGDTRDTQL